MGSTAEYFIKRLHSKDKQVVISTLGTLKHKVAGKSARYSLDSASFKHIVSFLKQPNHSLLSNTLSLLANCCMHDVYRNYFIETEGVTDLLVILKSLDSDEIACRAWRLAGNLSQSADICKALVSEGLPDRMLTFLANMSSLSAGTKGMAFRTIRKCCGHKSTRAKITTDEFISKLKDCLSLEDRDTVIMTLQLLFDLLQHSSLMDIEKKDIVQLVGLAKEEAYTEVCVKCLSAIVCNHVVSHLIEGSGLTELFIAFVETHSDVGKGFLSALCKLCREGGVRNKIRTASLFPALIKLCRGSNVPVLLMAFTQFQYDPDSITIMSQSQDLLSMLMENLSLAPAVCLLSLFTRLAQPIPALVTNDNLDILIQSPNCYTAVLSRLVNDKKYFKSLLLSGRVWSICAVGCAMDEIGSSGYAVGVVEHCLHTNDDNRRKIVCMAVPFLVKPRNFSLLYKLLARQNVMAVILQELKEFPPAESTVSSIVRLVKLFRENHKGETESMELDSSHKLFLEECGGPSGAEYESIEQPQVQSGGDNMVTFELDGGTCVTAAKDLLCAQSPVVNAMLNGHFAEANQSRVRLQDCTRRALAALVLLLEGRISTTSLELHTQLELISLADRLLIPTLGDTLTKSVPLSGANCAQVYLWSRSAGHSANASRIRARAYWELLSTADQLLPALRNDDCRELLIEEINVFLNRCLSDLL